MATEAEEALAGEIRDLVRSHRDNIPDTKRRVAVLFSATLAELHTNFEKPKGLSETMLMARYLLSLIQRELDHG